MANPYVNKVVVNGVTKLDISTDTVAANKMLSGTTAHDATGAAISGSIATKTSTDLTASGATVTAPAGYYASAASKSVASGSATTPATTKQQSQPSISVSSAGLITASVAATSVSVTPTVSAGYVSAGTAGTVTMSANSNTKQLTTQAAKTVTPSTTSQTAVASGVYTTGAITVAAIPNQKSDSGNVTLNASTTSKSYAAGYYANAHGAEISTETKSVTTNGTVTPSSGKVLTSVSVNVPLPSGAKWYGFRSWSSASIGANLALKNERWTNIQGTTGIAVGDNIILEVTNTDNNNVYAFLINVTSMNGTTAIGDAFACVEIGNTIAPVNPVTTYDGSVV